MPHVGNSLFLINADYRHPTSSISDSAKSSAGYPEIGIETHSHVVFRFSSVPSARARVTKTDFDSNSLRLKRISSTHVHYICNDYSRKPSSVRKSSLRYARDIARRERREELTNLSCHLSEARKSAACCRRSQSRILNRGIN